MPQTQCTNCAFTRRSLHHQDEYQSSVLLERLRTTNFPPTDEEISHVRHTILPTVSTTYHPSNPNSYPSGGHHVAGGRAEEVEKRPEAVQQPRFLASRASLGNLVGNLSIHTSWRLRFKRFRRVGVHMAAQPRLPEMAKCCFVLHSFWSTMDIYFPEAAQHEGDVQRLEAVIQRSHQGLLDVSLNDELSDTQTSNPSILKRIFDIVLAESYRWRVLHLSDWGGGLDMLYASLHTRLPRLEAVGFDCAPLELEGHSAVGMLGIEFRGIKSRS
ncbi:hypothetical protein BDZ89DRAFT_595812 [Hymenopellis radicata]|nr:hypothetical protein BDZ89DRAFT_595812 [Hymenopellis radicata]